MCYLVFFQMASPQMGEELAKKELMSKQVSTYVTVHVSVYTGLTALSWIQGSQFLNVHKSLFRCFFCLYSSLGMQLGVVHLHRCYRPKLEQIVVRFHELPSPN